MKLISLKGLILCTLILAQFSVLAITEFDPYSSSTVSQTARCMDIKNIARNGAGTNADNCTVCRPDKDSKGEIKIATDATTPLGTYGIKPISRNGLQNPFDCLAKINEDGTKENMYDQESKIPYCELYDNHGLCIRCMINFGLQWKATSSTDGAYKCVENRNRTPYCHKYNAAGVCEQCKWNQNSEQKEVYADHAYKLDFGLYNGKCVSNLQIDYQTDTFSASNKLSSSEIVSNCAEYSNDKKCLKCHYRKFDMEGEIPMSGARSNRDWILRKKGADDTKPVCVAHLTTYVTHPSLLVQMNGTNANDSDNNLFTDKDTDANKTKTNAQCDSGFELWKNGSTTEYGCVETTNVSGCDEIELDWDREAFQKTGEWYKKFSKCTKCYQKDDNSVRYFLNQDTNKCLTGFQDEDTHKCIAYKGTDCMACKDNYNVILIENRTTNGGVNSYSFKRICSNANITGTNSNCKSTINSKVYADNVDTQKNTDFVQCLECNEGYVLKQKDIFSNRLECAPITDAFTRGCKLLDKNGACITGNTGAFGYSASGFCNSRRYNDLSCILTTGKTNVENCQNYYHTYSDSTCIECKTGYYLIQGGSQCIKTSTSDTYVENCEVLDGTWCQKCRDTTNGGNTVKNVVTENNVCVTKDAGIDTNCIQVNGVQGAQACVQCAYGYSLAGATCTQWDIKKTPATNKVKIMTLAQYVMDVPTVVDGDEVVGCRYYFDDTGHCYQCHQKDNQYYGVSVDNNDKQTCVLCPNGTNLGLEQGVTNGKKYLKCKSTASAYTNNEIGDLHLCEHGYAPKDGANNGDPTTCTLINTYGCIRYSNAGDCKTCEWPYQLNNNKKCIIQQPNCIEYDTAMSCKACAPGYQLNASKKCYKKPNRCSAMDWEKSWNPLTQVIQTQVCSTCLYSEETKQGLRLFLNEATNLEYGCLGGCQHRVRSMRTRIDNNPHNIWTCTQCRNEQFHFNQSIKWCVEATNIDKCTTYTNDIAKFDETCEICNSSYYLSTNKKACTSCTLPDNCTTSDGKTTITVSGTQKCRCTVCSQNPTKYYLQADGTCKTSNINNCQTYSNVGVCTLCSSGYYLTNDQCIQYSSNLGCLTFNPNADQCLTCNKAESYLNSSFKCIIQDKFPNCRYFSQTDVKGETCDECVDGYGLRVDYKECISNTWDVSAANKKYGQSKCFRYATQIQSDGYWHCIQCYNGFAFDYSFSKFKEDKGQCVKVDNCQKGKYKTGNTQTADQECYTCKTRDSANNLVYRKQDTADSQVGTCTSIATTANTVKRCKNYIGTKCSECHTSFQPDYDIDGNGGTICVSEDHPGALSGCRQYDVVIDTTATTIKWSKYEFLRCSKCYKSWNFHSFTGTTGVTPQLYSLNTYNRECDTVTSDVSFTLPSTDKWEGKDGGVIDTTDPNDKEEYEDPVLLSNKLTFSILALLLLLAL